MSVRDESSRRPILEWHGDIAAELLSAQPLAPTMLAAGSYRIDKGDVQELALAATAFKLKKQAALQHDAIDRDVRASEALWLRLQQLRIRIPSCHAHVARRLFKYPDSHFSENDALCLLELSFPYVGRARLQRCLHKLACWDVIQRIQIDGLCFFDTNTEPHLHVYNTRTRELHDAPPIGVVKIH